MTENEKSVFEAAAAHPQFDKSVCLSEIEKMRELDPKLIEQLWSLYNLVKDGDRQIGDKNKHNSFLAYYLGLTTCFPVDSFSIESRRTYGRAGFPDIDMDFDYVRRHEIVDYLIEKYGREYVGNIGSVQTLKIKAALRRAIKTLDPTNSVRYDNKGREIKSKVNANFMLENEILKTLPRLMKRADGSFISSVDEAYEEYPSFKKHMDAYPNIRRVATAIEGTISGFGCLSKDTDIKTEHGYCRIDQIDNTVPIAYIDVNGQEKYTHDYSAHRTGNKKCYKLQLNDGSWIKVTDEHLVFTDQGCIEFEKIRHNPQNYKVWSIKEFMRLESIESIEECDIDEVWDITMGSESFFQDEPNFIAQDILVHNCHAAGIVLSPIPLSRIAPMHVTTRRAGVKGEEPQKVVATQFPMNDVESMGLIKFDVLGLATITAVEWACQSIKEERGIDIDWNSISINDPDVFALLNSGKTDGCFQLECVSGNTFVSAHYNIEDLYNSWTNGSVLRIKPKSVDLANGCYKMSSISKVVKSNLKVPLYRVVVGSKNEIRVTQKHNFLTPDGWKQLNELKVGDRVLVDKKSHYSRSCENCGVELRSRSRGLKINKLCKVCTCNPSRLETRCKQEIAELELEFGNLVNWECGSVPSRCGWQEITDISYERDDYVYDICMSDEFKNYRANGFIVHNSPGMKECLKMIGMDSFDDLVVAIAMYRPGPKDYIPEFSARKRGNMQVVYPHPIVERYTKNTYSIIVYQEQAMQIFVHLAGLTNSEGYLFIKGSAKKDPELFQSMKKRFIDGASRKASKEIAEKVWAQMEPFQGYAFNLAHATSYACESFKTAYLKAHYSAEFIAARLSVETVRRNFDDVDKYERDATKNFNFTILPPDLNTSKLHWSIVSADERILRKPLLIKGVGIKAAEEIIKHQPYQGKNILVTFTKKVGSAVNAKVMEAMKDAGFWEGISKKKLLKDFEQLRKDKKRGQGEPDNDMYP